MVHPQPPPPPSAPQEKVRWASHRTPGWYVQHLNTAFSPRVSCQCKCAATPKPVGCAQRATRQPAARQQPAGRLQVAACRDGRPARRCAVADEGARRQQPRPGSRPIGRGSSSQQRRPRAAAHELHHVARRGSRAGGRKARGRVWRGLGPSKGDDSPPRKHRRRSRIPGRRSLPPARGTYTCVAAHARVPCARVTRQRHRDEQPLRQGQQPCQLAVEVPEGAVDAGRHGGANKPRLKLLDEAPRVNQPGYLGRQLRAQPRLLRGREVAGVGAQRGTVRESEGRKSGRALAGGAVAATHPSKGLS